MSIRHLKGLSEVMDHYDGVILDLWGVVHDGIAPFADTKPALEALRAAGKKIWLLSNAPRRAATVQAHLAAMGIAALEYDGILTSGEATHLALKSHLVAQWGPRCYTLGPNGDPGLFQGLDVVFAERPAEADFVLANSIHNGLADSLAAYHPILDDCAAAGLPMLCANPDKVVHVGDSLILCPGSMAAVYGAMGQQVTYFGKPYPAVYDQILAAMGTRRVLAVGDGLETDVAGARRAGLDVALVASGIHRDDLFAGLAEIGRESVPNQNRLRGLLEGGRAEPTFLINGLRW